MKKVLAFALCLVFVLSLAACGGGDALKGTWTCEDRDTGTVVWTFNGSGKCDFANDYFEGKGTYTITDSQVTIVLDLWDSEKVYDFTVTENGLNLTATDALSPSYDLIKK